MIIKSSRVHRLNKNKLDKEKDLFLNTSQFLYNRNVFHDRKIDDKDEKLVYNINSIIIREDFLFNQDEVFIEDCDAKNIYFENNKNLGGITIPYNFIEKSKPLKIINKNKK